MSVARRPKGDDGPTAGTGAVDETKNRRQETPQEGDDADVALLGRWIDEHWGRLVQVARRYAGPGTGAQDIVQDAIWSAYCKREQLADPAATARWLEGFVRRIGLRAVRKRNRRQRLLSSRAEDLRQDRCSSAEVDSEQTAKSKMLEEAIATLPDFLRAVVRMKLQEMTHAQIAEALKISERTAKRRYAAAVAEFRRILVSKTQGGAA